jgi:hypothetical protein
MSEQPAKRGRKSTMRAQLDEIATPIVHKYRYVRETAERAERLYALLAGFASSLAPEASAAAFMIDTWQEFRNNDEWDDAAIMAFEDVLKSSALQAPTSFRAWFVAWTTGITSGNSALWDADMTWSTFVLMLRNFSVTPALVERGNAIVKLLDACYVTRTVQSPPDWQEVFCDFLHTLDDDVFIASHKPPKKTRMRSLPESDDDR